MITKKINDIEKLKMGLQLHLETLLISLQIDIDDFVVTETEIRGTAPCHNGADNPSAFTYYYNTGTWRCWTNGCHTKVGCDLLGLIRVVKKISFAEAVYFANDFLSNKTEISDKEVELKQLSKKLLLKTDFWNKHLLQKTYDINILKKLAVADAYAKQRGLCIDIIKNIGAGIAQNGPMKNRMVIPIYNIHGALVGFSGRKINDKENIPKWKHWGFEKSINLFNINNVQNSIEIKHKVVLCEGPFDVIKLQMAGINNAVAIMGTHISEGQASLLCRCHAMDVVLALDNDTPAQQSMPKNTHLLQRKMFNVFNIVPTKKDWGEMSIEEIQQVFGDKS